MSGSLALRTSTPDTTVKHSPHSPFPDQPPYCSALPALPAPAPAPISLMPASSDEAERADRDVLLGQLHEARERHGHLHVLRVRLGNLGKILSSGFVEHVVVGG